VNFVPQVAAGGHEVALSLKNRRDNIESQKFDMIMKFLSWKFTLKLILRDSQNFWTTKIWSYTVFHMTCSTDMDSCVTCIKLWLFCMQLQSFPIDNHIFVLDIR